MPKILILTRSDIETVDGDLVLIVHTSGATETKELLTPLPPALPSISAAAKITLFEAGLLQQVETAVSAHKYEPVRIWYRPIADCAPTHICQRPRRRA